MLKQLLTSHLAVILSVLWDKLMENCENFCQRLSQQRAFWVFPHILWKDQELVMVVPSPEATNSKTPSSRVDWRVVISYSATSPRLAWEIICTMSQKITWVSQILEPFWALCKFQLHQLMGSCSNLKTAAFEGTFLPGLFSICWASAWGTAT